jgi:hypothetical protein
VHLVVGDVPSLPEVDGIDDLVIPVLLVAVEVFCLPTVT